VVDVTAGWLGLRRTGHIGGRFGAEFFEAMTATKEVHLPAVLVPVSSRGRIYVHTTDRVFHGRPAFPMVVMVYAGDIVWPLCLVLAHRDFSYCFARWRLPCEPAKAQHWRVRMRFFFHEAPFDLCTSITSLQRFVFFSQ
jgi:hypothetical protein